MNVIFVRWLWLVAITTALIVLVAPVAKPTSRAIANPSEGWAFPRLDGGADPKPFLASINRGNLWGVQADASNGAIDRSGQWRVAAIVGQGLDRSVVIEFGDDKVLPLKAGQKFPDGTPILDIKENGVCVQLSNGRRFLPLADQANPIVW